MRLPAGVVFGLLIAVPSFAHAGNDADLEKPSNAPAKKGTKQPPPPKDDPDGLAKVGQDGSPVSPSQARMPPKDDPDGLAKVGQDGVAPAPGTKTKLPPTDDPDGLARVGEDGMPVTAGSKTKLPPSYDPDGLAKVDDGAATTTETKAGPALVGEAPTEPPVAEVLDDPPPFEFGVFGGGFITNFYHQFYEVDKFEGNPGGARPRPLLQKVSPIIGLRGAYFIKPWLGVEGEFNVMMTNTLDIPMTPAGSATIYSGHVQVIFQYPDLSSIVVPFVTVGDGFMHTSSGTLGSDTDWPLNTDVGARFLVHRSITLRAEGRFLRGPSSKDPWTLDASYAEFMFGISYRPSNPPPEPPPPPPPPKVDSDGDGLTDDVDKCPNEPEDKDLFDDMDGCPDPDNDADGVPDTQDRCPLDPEDKDGFSDEDGCPDEDDDADGVPDKQDKCPREAEDKDGFQDLDGCPELDNDKDMIPDAQDQCPNEPEVINGVDDTDGCPDRGNALVIVSPDRLDLLDNVVFKKTVIQKESFNLLDQVGAQLRIHPEIVRLRITIHVQPTKDPDADQRLSETRAFAIREYLIKFGIDEKRLEPRGFGGTKPLVDPKSKGAKDINERLELIILERQ